MTNIFCRQCGAKLEAESHSGAYYCINCNLYPYVHETTETLEPSEIIWTCSCGKKYIIDLDYLDTNARFEDFCSCENKPELRPPTLGG